MGGWNRDKRLWIGVAVSLLALWLLLRSMDWHKVCAAFREMDARYLLPAIASTLISYLFRALRWKYLLLPLKQIGLSSLFPATIIGYMANNLLPARLGEFIRAYDLARREKLSGSAVFASLVIDRLLDGFSVLLLLLLTLLTVRLPEGGTAVTDAIRVGGYAIVSVYCCVVVVLVMLKRNQVRTLAILEKLLGILSQRLSQRLLPLAVSFMQGMTMASGGKVWVALAASSLAIWASATWPIDLVLRAFAVPLPVSASMLIMVLLVFAVLVPASPGYVGTYHAACVYGLLAFSVPKEKAMSIALVVHGLSFLPAVLLGLYYLWRDKTSLGRLSRQTLPEEG